MKALMLLGSLWLGGCAQWPAPGAGGMAELRPTRIPLNEGERKVWVRYDERQKKLDRQLGELRQARLRECMPGELKQLQSQRIEITRDMHGRLWSEVAWRQTMLESRLQQVRVQLAQTTREGCRTDWSGVALRQWRQT